MSSKLTQVSYTKLSTFRRCLMQYDRKYVRGYYPKSGIGQDRGTAGHAAVAEWHRSLDPQKALQAAWDSWSGNGHEDNEDWGLLDRALQRYFSFSQENDHGWKLLGAEQKFEIVYEVPTGATLFKEGEGSYPETAPVNFMGYIDGIVEEGGRTWLLENKFWKRVEENFLDMDAQVSAYLLAASACGFETIGVIYNIIRVGDTALCEREPVIRKRIYRSPYGLGAIEAEMVAQIQAMLRYHKEGGTPYRNVTKDCHWDCAFHQACLSLLDDGQENTVILENVCNPRRNDDGNTEEDKW